MNLCCQYLTLDNDILNDEAIVSDNDYPHFLTVNMVSSLHQDPPLPPESSLSLGVDSSTLAYINLLSDLQLLVSIKTNNATKYTVPYDIDGLHPKLQANGGANCSVTNLKEIFTVTWDIAPHHMNGTGDGIISTTKGPLIFSDGSTVLIEMFYSADASGTIISPTDIVFNHSNFDSW